MRNKYPIAEAVASLNEAEGHQLWARERGMGVGVEGVFLPQRESLVAIFGKIIFIMQNPAFWCIIGSENGQLLTGADPEGTARGRTG